MVKKRRLGRLTAVLFLGGWVFCSSWHTAIAQADHENANPAELWREIDPFLGTMQGGDVEPGPSVPFGMVKPGPDVGPNTENGGWLPEGDINGFSQTHMSGTGGGASGGNILLQATKGRLEPRHNGSLRSAEEASAGYYAVDLVRFGIRAEVTTAARADIYRFTFRERGPAHLVLDVSHCLSSGAEYGEAQRTVASEVHMVSSTEMVGSSSVAGGWNKQPVPYTVYFVLQTDTPATSMDTFRGNDVYAYHREEAASDSTVLGAIFSFDVRTGQQVRVKMGLSYVSVEQARQNLQREIGGFDFDRVKHQAEQAWNTAVSTVEIDGTTPEQMHLAYTALYHSMLMPVDRTGENPLWKSDEPYYDNFYTVWDTFRTSTPLLTLIAENQASRIARAMVDIYRHDGWLPDGRQGNYNGRTQGGSNGDMVIADGFVKHLPGVNWLDAYAAVTKDAEISPADQMKEGRGGLEDWKRLGYVTIEGVDRPAPSRWNTQRTTLLLRRSPPAWERLTMQPSIVHTQRTGRTCGTQA